MKRRCSVYLVRGTVMEREKRLGKRREQYHARRNRETAEEIESRLEVRRACERHQHPMMLIEQRQILLQWKRQARNHSEPIAVHQPHCNKILSPDDPFVISKMSEFYNHLNGLSMMKCFVYSERFPNIRVNSAGSCKRTGHEALGQRILLALSPFHWLIFLQNT